MIFLKFIEWIFWILFWIESFQARFNKKIEIPKNDGPSLGRGEGLPLSSCCPVMPCCSSFIVSMNVLLCYTEIHVETSPISILWCCLPSLPHLSSLLLLFLQLSRVHLLQQCRVAGVWLLRWRWIYYMGWWVGGACIYAPNAEAAHISTLTKRRVNLDLQGRGRDHLIWSSIGRKKSRHSLNP